MTVAEIFAIIRDAAATIAAAAATYVGIAGLDAWRKQLKGKSEYELARRYLRAAYKVRDALKFVRNPFISPEEFSTALNETGLQDEGKQQTRNVAVYTVRWKKVQEAVSELDLEQLEAEVLWGKSAVDVRKPLNDCVRDLFIALRKHFIETDRRPEESKFEEVFHTVYDTGENDRFAARANEAVTGIETYLKPHLR